MARFEVQPSRFSNCVPDKNVDTFAEYTVPPLTVENQTTNACVFDIEALNKVKGVAEGYSFQTSSQNLLME